MLQRQKGKVMISAVDVQTDEFQTCVSENKEFVKEFIRNEIPQIQAASFYDLPVFKTEFCKNDRKRNGSCFLYQKKNRDVSFLWKTEWTGRKRVFTDKYCVFTFCLEDNLYR